MQAPPPHTRSTRAILTNVGYVAVSSYNASRQESDASIGRRNSRALPAAPRNLEAGAFPNSRIRLQWQDMSSAESGFEVERASGTLSPTTYTLIAHCPPNTVVYTDTPPILEDTYWYRVRAYNMNGGSPIQTKPITQLSFGPPTSTNATC